MPRYLYFCENCEEEFEFVHSMNETFSHCLSCSPEQNTLKRIPSKISVKTTQTENNVKAGQAVKEYIEDNKESLKDLKNKLKDRKWK